MFRNFAVTPICSSTAKKSSQLKRSHLSNRSKNALVPPSTPPPPPPPPPEFHSDDLLWNREKQQKIQANGPGLKDGFIDDHCSYTCIH